MVREKIGTYENEEGYLDIVKVLNETKVLSYLVGNRSIGKTFGTMKYTVENSLRSVIEKYSIESIEDFEKMPKNAFSDFQFFYLRRYITQIREAKEHRLIEPDFYSNFLDDIPEDVLLRYDYTIRFEGSAEGIREIYFVFEDKENPKRKKKILIGYLSCISANEKIRGVGFPKVKIIILDEFQSKKLWDYIPNEPGLLMDIVHSIKRNRKDCKAVALGNAGSILNPHFAYYEYDEFENERTEKKKGTVCFYHFDIKAKNDEDFINAIEGTAYGDYALNNEYVDYQTFNVVKLEDAPSPRKCSYNVILNGSMFGVWIDGDRRTILSRLSDPDIITYVDKLPGHNQTLSQDVYITLADKIKNHFLYFDSADIRIEAEKALQRYVFKKSGSWEEAK